MIASRLWRFVMSGLGSSRPAPTWQLVSDRLNPSTFSGLRRCTLPEFHLRYPFSRHDFRCDGRDSRWRFVTGRNYPANHYDLLQSVTVFAIHYGSPVLDMTGVRSLFLPRGAVSELPKKLRSSCLNNSALKKSFPFSRPAPKPGKRLRERGWPPPFGPVHLWRPHTASSRTYSE